MTRTFRILVFAVAIGAAFVSSASAQTSNLQYQVANVVEDQRLMMEQMRRVMTELDDLRRENARLKEMVRDLENNTDSKVANYATITQMNDLIRQAKTALEARDEVLRKEMIAMVSSELEAFGKTVNKALGSVSAPAKPDPNVKTNFDTSTVPKSGTPYTVQPGDSIAGIAKKLNSRIDWIQNINKISDPRLLQVGQVIFVPQEASE